MRTLPLTTVLLVLAASAAFAQTSQSSQDPGRARLTVDEPWGETARYEGELERWEADSLSLILDSGIRRTFDALSVISVDQYGGTKNSWLTGALIGTAVGLVVAVIGTTIDSKQESGSDVAIVGAAYAMAWSIAIPVGFGVGALIGASVQKDVWEPANRDDWRQGGTH